MGGMDLTLPLGTLIPSLDSAVLEVLARTESGLSASQIARLSARGTRAGQAAVLSRLVAHGLVMAEKANTGYLYRLNRAHVLAARQCSPRAAVRQELVSRLAAAILRPLDPAPVSAALVRVIRRGVRPARTVISTCCSSSRTASTGIARRLAGTSSTDLEQRVLAWTGNRLRGRCSCPSGSWLAALGAGEPLMRSLRD